MRSGDISTSGFFVLRTPLLPFDDFIRWGDSLRARQAYEAQTDAAAREAWRADVEKLRARLRDLVDRPEVRQALFVASPSLESSIRHWKRDPDSKKGLQTERSLVRYFARMSGRATPFGLLAGCSVGTVADGPRAAIDDDLLLRSRKHYRLNSRLDYEYLVALTSSLQCVPQLAAGLRFWPNSTLHKIADVWHYVEAKVIGSHGSHHLVRLHNDNYLDTILERAREGATIRELVEALLLLLDGSEVSEEDAMDYIQELVNAQVLVSSLSPLVTGESPLDDLINQLASLPSGAHVAETLRTTHGSLVALDRKGLGAPRTDYDEIAARLGSLTATINLSRLFQVDMIKPFQKGLLCGPVINELIGATEFLCAIGASPPEEPDKVRMFREAFSFRYGQAWVPLVQVLDEEIGIGFGRHVGSAASAAVRGLPVAYRPVRSGPRLREFHSVLLRKVVECAGNGSNELLLETSDLPISEPTARSLPGAFSIRASIVARSMAAVREGDFRIYLLSGVGPSGATLLGRFCHADPELECHVRNHLRQEEANDPDAIYAEVVHLPEARIGNILCRPVLRDYEIVYLGRPGSHPDRQIAVSDLLVTVTQDEQILLYSRRLKKRVIPRLTTAHGFSNPRLASLYQFLCYLQYQPRTNVPIFDWGPLGELPFLPRVRAGRVVFAGARWRITPEEAKEIAKRGRRECFFAVQELRRSRKLPRWVLFAESDGTLPVDLDNPLSVDAFVHVLKRAGKATLLEMYLGPDEMCVTGPEGHFQHELVVPFVSRPCRRDSDQATSPEQAQRVWVTPNSTVDPNARTLPPGSNWLYVKLYGGTATHDEILTTALPPLLCAAFSGGLISSWFFVRYADPHQHLRIRFHGAPSQLSQGLLPLIASSFNPLLAGQRLWKIEFDTYQREIERYGGLEGMLNSEEIFFADSEAVLTILQALSGDDGPDVRLRIAIVGADRLLSDCGLNLLERRAAIQRAREFLQREFRVDVNVRRRLGERFRVQHGTLETLLDDSHDRSIFMDAVRKALEFRSLRIAAAIQRLHSLEQTGRLSHSICELAVSYVHMHVNRVMCSIPRAHELVLYDFLFRIYSGRLARGEKCGSAVPAIDRGPYADRSETNARS